MSFDLLPDEADATMMRAAQRPSMAPEPGVWGGFIPGAASLTMEGFAKTARAIDLLGVIGPMVEDRLTGGGTSDTDKYFQEHDAIWNRAVDYWTPKPGEVGTAGRVAGSLLPVLAQAVISPSLAVGSAEMGASEDLVRRGIDADKAVKAGIVQGTGLGLGMYLPIFGTSFAMRALVAGAGSNVVQGIASRAAARKVLEGTPVEKEYDPWDAESLLVDSLMGVGFGSLAHLTAADQAKMALGRSALTESDRAAILTANQARHMEDTTAPGRPVTDVDRTLHAAAMRKAIDDVLNGRPAEVGQIVQDAHFAEDPARAAQAAELRQAVSDEARQAVVEAIQREQRVIEAQETPGFLRSAEQVLALKKGEQPVDYAPELARAVEITKKPGFLRTAEEKVTLDTFLKGRGAEVLMRDIPELPRPLVDEPKAAVEGVPKEAAAAKPEVPAEPPDPIVAEARQRVAENPDLSMVGEDGKPVKVGDMLHAVDRESAQSRELEGLLPAAAQCFMGML